MGVVYRLGSLPHVTFSLVRRPHNSLSDASSNVYIHFLWNFFKVLVLSGLSSDSTYALDPTFNGTSKGKLEQECINTMSVLVS